MGKGKFMKPLIKLKTALSIFLTATTLLATETPQWNLASRMYGDRKARRVGDLLTVLIVEESSVKKDAQQSSDKSFDFSGNVSFFHPRIDAKPVAWTNFTIPTWQVDTKRGYSGKGSLENKDTLSGAIAVRVMEVLPNGNLLIEGKRTVYVHNEAVGIILTGTVRVEDIDKDNTVKSTDVADACIRYESTGTIAESQKKGIVPALLDWINPF
jgi:flagellar L-ring protein FlgH